MDLDSSQTNKEWRLFNTTVAIIGAGNWGRNLVRKFCEILGAENVHCFDIDHRILSQMKSRYPGLNINPDINFIWDNPTIDSVIIAAPVEKHFDLAKRSLISGKNVLVEKPMTETVEQAEELCQLSSKYDKLLMVDHLLLYHPVVVDIRNRIRKGEIGETYYMSSQRLNLGVVRSNENVLWSLAPHDIALAIDLISEQPHEVSAQGAVFIQPTLGIEDVASATLKFPSGKIATLQLSWLDPHKVRKVTIVGDKKMIVFDDMEAQDKLKIYDKGVKSLTDGNNIQVRYGDLIVPNIRMKEPLGEMCMHFLESVENNTTPYSNGISGLQTVKVLNAAQKSISQNGSPVSLVNPIAND